MQQWSPIEPWDEQAMTDALMELVPTLPRTRLDLLDAPRMPGAYVQFIKSDDLTREALAILGPAADGTVPIYCGVAERSLRDRVNRYRQAIAGIRAFNETNVTFLLVPCRSASSAKFTEAALIAELEPVLQGFGHGARSQQGGARRTQQTSAIDALFGGRPHTRPAEPVRAAAAAARVIVELAGRDASALRWPPIPTPEEVTMEEGGRHMRRGGGLPRRI